MRIRDKIKQAKRSNEHYHRNSKEIMEKAREADRKKIEQIKLLKKNPCADCKKEYPHYVMDFDHIKGAKEINISQAVNKGWSMKRILDEIEKCELVCSNCHRIRTFGNK